MSVDPRVLGSVPLLADASPGARAVLAAGSVERRFAAGAVQFTAGSPARGLVILLEGRVRVLRATAEGRQHVIHTEGPGGTLGEVPLYTGGGYPATAVAIEPVRCVVIGRAVL